MTRRIDSRFHDGNPCKFYCPENAPWISFGWIGGLIDTYPMLALGDDMHLRRVTETFDFAIPRAQGKAGYFYGLLEQDGSVRGREGYDDHPEICLTRKNGDVLFWMIKQFALLKAQKRNDAINPRWEQSMRRLADAFVATWKKHHQWGNFVNVDTGDVAVYNTTGGAMAVGGLALAANYFHNAEYLDVAKQAAQFYYDRDVLGLGVTTGGCADILQNADSETAAGFMTSLMALYETTGDRQWLEKSRALANLTATWVVSYDYELPPDTELARLGAKAGRRGLGEHAKQARRTGILHQFRRSALENLPRHGRPPLRRSPPRRHSRACRGHSAGRPHHRTPDLLRCRQPRQPGRRFHRLERAERIPYGPGSAWRLSANGPERSLRLRPCRGPRGTARRGGRNARRLQTGRLGPLRSRYSPSLPHRPPVHSVIMHFCAGLAWNCSRLKALK